MTLYYTMVKKGRGWKVRDCKAGEVVLIVTTAPRRSCRSRTLYDVTRGITRVCINKALPFQRGPLARGRETGVYDRLAPLGRCATDTSLVNP